jgi:hypothetical protein
MGAPDPDIAYKIPDLSHLHSRNILNLALDTVVGQDSGPESYPFYGIWMNLVRLTDKSLQSYQAARKALESYRKVAYQGGIAHFYLAIDLFENVVSAAYRSVLNAERLDEVVSKQLLHPTVRQRNILRLARNHVEHMDEKLSQRQVKQEEVHVLVPLQSRLEIGSVRLPYRDLASCITKMYRNIELIRQTSSN